MTLLLLVRLASVPALMLALLPLPAAAQTTEDVSWTTGDVTLHGTLFLPAGAGRAPAAIVLHGSGNVGRIRNAGSKVMLNHAERLQALGVAVLVYDKRGVGQSGGSFRDAGFDVLTSDAEGGLAVLAAHPRVDAGRIGTVAISQGGWLATMLVERGHALAFHIMVTAGPPVTPAAQELVVQRNRMSAAGASQADIEAGLALIRQSHEAFRTGTGWESLAAAAAALRSRPWHQRAELPIPERTDTWWRWYASFMDYDPAPALSRIRAPIFVAFGAHDVLLDSADMARRYAALPNQDVLTVRTYDAGHALRIGRSTDQPEAYWADLEAWLRAAVLR